MVSLPKPRNTEVFFVVTAVVFAAFLFSASYSQTSAAFFKKYEMFEYFQYTDSWDRISAIHFDSYDPEYYYVAGIKDRYIDAANGIWTIQGRSTESDELLWQQTWSPCVGFGEVFDLIEDDDYVYGVGTTCYTNYWGLQKIDKVTGVYSWRRTQPVSGVGERDENAFGVDTDGTYLYTVGEAELPGGGGRRRRYEMRSLAGSVSYYRHTDSTPYWTVPRDIVVDGAIGYVVGSDNEGSGNARWFVERIDLPTYALPSLQMITPDPTVGDDFAYSLDQDATYIYIAGKTSVGGRIERRLKTDLSLDWGVDTDVDQYYDISYHDGALYLAGSQASTDDLGSLETVIEVRDPADGGFLDGKTTNISDGDDEFRAVSAGTDLEARTRILGGGYESSLEEVQWFLQDWVELPDGTPEINAISLYDPGNEADVVTGSYVRSTSMDIEFTVSDTENPDTVTVEFEIIPVGESYTGTATHTAPDVALTGSPRSSTFRVDDLIDNTEYYMKYRACDSGDKCGVWTEYGGNAGSAVDFITDATNPSDPVLTYISHEVGVWSSDNTIYLEWSLGEDTTSGVSGYSYEWSHEPLTVPDSVQDIVYYANFITSEELWNGDDVYFHMRTKDNAGNWTSTIHEGPFYIDASPVVASIQINNGNATTFSSSVDLQIEGGEDFSGVSEMKICNLASMRACHWQDYDSLTEFGLLSGTGERTVYVQLKSPTGAVSEVAHDTINVVEGPDANAGGGVMTVQYVSVADDHELPDEGIIQIVGIDEYEPGTEILDSTPTFQGSSEPRAVVTVEIKPSDGGDSIFGEVTADDEGVWLWAPESPLAFGDYELIASIENPDGTKDEKTLAFAIAESEDEPQPEVIDTQEPEESEEEITPDSGKSKVLFIVGIVVLGAMVPVVYYIIMKPKNASQRT